MELSALRSSKKEEEKAAARTHSLKLGTYDSPVKTNLSKAHPSTRRTEPHLARSLLMNGEVMVMVAMDTVEICARSREFVHLYQR